jgi:hypothetical protein
MCIVGVSEEEHREKGEEGIFEDVMAENILNENH